MLSYVFDSHPFWVLEIICPKIEPCLDMLNWRLPFSIIPSPLLLSLTPSLSFKQIHVEDLCKSASCISFRPIHKHDKGTNVIDYFFIISGRFYQMSQLIVYFLSELQLNSHQVSWTLNICRNFTDIFVKDKCTIFFNVNKTTTSIGRFPFCWSCLVTILNVSKGGSSA